MFELFLRQEIAVYLDAHSAGGARFGELYGKSHHENGQASVSSVSICSTILKDNLNFTLTWIFLVQLFMILKDTYIYFLRLCTEQTFKYLL